MNPKEKEEEVVSEVPAEAVAKETSKKTPSGTKARTLDDNEVGSPPVRKASTAKQLAAEPKKKVPKKKKVEPATQEGMRAAMKEFRNGDKARKRYGKSELATMDEVGEHVSYIFLPDICAMWALGRPGYATRKIGEMLGFEGCGKTTSMYWMSKMVMDVGGFAAMVETEDAVVHSHAAAVLGEHYDLFQDNFFQADTFESGLQMVLDALDTFEKYDKGGTLPKIIIFDSVAGSATNNVQDQSLEVSKILSVGFGEKARILKPYLEHVRKRLKDTNTTLIFGNQGKEKIYTGLESRIKRATIDKVKGEGGKSLDFFTTYWEYLQKGAVIKDASGGKRGFQIRHTFKKNKVRFPFRQFTSEVDFQRGVIFERPTIDALYASDLCGISKVKGPKFWCEERDIGSDGRPMGYIDFYKAIHSVDHIAWFMSKFDIEMPPRISQVYFPSEWGGQVPNFLEFSSSAAGAAGTVHTSEEEEDEDEGE